MKKRMIGMLLAVMFLFAGCGTAGADDAFTVPETVRLGAEKALAALSAKLEKASGSVWVYKDFGDTENHFTQKAKMWGLNEGLVHDMNENWRDDPFSGTSCIRCEQETVYGDWGGWMFLNGYLEDGSTVPRLNDGSAAGQGLDLTGAETLTFYVRGEKGGEVVEFFTCGFGRDGNTATVAWPDSAAQKSLGFVTLSDRWEAYSIDLESDDMSSIACGFGYVLSGGDSGLGTSVFYLDDIRFTGSLTWNENTNYLLRSYETDSIYIQNAAFTYDNALAAMAFLSAGMKDEAEELLDAFVYAVDHDRYSAGRIRNAYAAGDITAYPGWGDTARMPGWYDPDTGSWYEDQYQTGSNVGNTSYAALALLQYDAVYGSEEYVKTAARLMDWVIDSCGGDAPGFTGGYDGWPESGTVDVYTYKSIEHNIDAYAAFRRLAEVTGEKRYADAADSAFAFIRSMYDDNSRVFWTGTTSDGVTPDTGNTVLDAQVWACMALGDEFAPYTDALETVAAMASPEGAYPFCLSNVNGGWWAEGTAYTALMYRELGDQTRAEAALEALAAVQLGTGMLPAATVPDLSTGIWLFTGEPWTYGTDPHIAPTAWFVMAVNGFDPYRMDHSN